MHKKFSKCSSFQVQFHFSSCGIYRPYSNKMQTKVEKVAFLGIFIRGLPGMSLSFSNQERFQLCQHQRTAKDLFCKLSQLFGEQKELLITFHPCYCQPSFRVWSPSNQPFIILVPSISIVF